VSISYLHDLPSVVSLSPEKATRCGGIDLWPRLGLRAAPKVEIPGNADAEILHQRFVTVPVAVTVSVGSFGH